MDVAWLYVLAALLVGAMVYGAVYLIGDYRTATSTLETVTVIDLYYEPARTGTGSATTINPSNGQVGVGSSTVYIGAKYSLLAEFSDGRRELLEVDKKAFLAARKNAKIALAFWYGGRSRKLLGISLPDVSY